MTYHYSRHRAFATCAVVSRGRGPADTLLAWEKHNQYGTNTACTCTTMGLRLDISEPGPGNGRGARLRSLDRSGQERYGRGVTVGWGGKR